MIDFNIIFSFALAYLVTMSVTPLIRVLAFKMDAVDVPKDNRRMHDHPIARMGGLAIFLGVLLSTLIFVPLTDQVSANKAQTNIRLLQSMSDLP